MLISIKKDKTELLLDPKREKCHKGLTALENRLTNAFK